jgi:ferredoxin
MKTIIYYFTGTGNSLAVARKIAAGLEDCELVPIASLHATQGDIPAEADRVGIVCPVYFSGLPSMVAEFAGRLDLSRSTYTFAVVTLGGSGGSSTLRQLSDVLAKRPGHGLDAGFTVRMPGNYILMYGSPEGRKRERILASADKELEKIVDAIRKGERPMPSSLFAGLVHALLYPRFVAGVHDRDREFLVSDACTSCGTCKEICPSENIELVDGRPVWKHRCELCCGCIHLCPTQAIQAGKKTTGRTRYRNPHISVSDLKTQKKRNQKKSLQELERDVQAPPK